MPLDVLPRPCRTVQLAYNVGVLLHALGSHTLIVLPMVVPGNRALARANPTGCGDCIPRGYPTGSTASGHSLALPGTRQV